MQQTAEKQKPSILNGVNLDQLFGNIDAIKNTPVLGKFKFRANNKWINGGHNHTTIKNFHGVQQEHDHASPFELDADEPPLLLGEDIGPNPVEYALTALAACVTTALVYHAAAKGITLNAVESRLEGDIDLRGFLGISDKVRRGYDNVRIYYKIDADVSDEELEELIQMGCKYSPVFDTFTNPVNVTAQLDR
jgi:uncharacterized OsmC-like protein